MAKNNNDVHKRASDYVCQHGQFVREGVYTVRYPQYAANGFIIADEPAKLTIEVAKRMTAPTTDKREV